ncbi:hypothetical protein RUND412_000833 [Rhizina undulata]
MADSAQDDHNARDATNMDPNRAGANPNYFENMGSMNSLANTAVHVQSQQQSGYGPHQTTAPQASAAHNMVDPLFYLNDHQHQQGQPQPHYYPHHPSYVPVPPQEQWQHVIAQQLGGNEFQQLLGQFQYQNQQQHQQAHQAQLLALQQARGQGAATAAAAAVEQGNITAQNAGLLHAAHAQSPPLPTLQKAYTQHPQRQALSASPVPPGVRNVVARSTESSALSSPLSALDVTTPMDVDTAPQSAKATGTPTVRTVPDRTLTKGRSDYRPKTAIPQDLTAEEYAQQCIQAAIASRLPPYGLHPAEYQMLREHISYPQVTTYVHIRNGILRLWQRNSMVSVTREEAAGCAKDYRFFDVAEVAYEFLVRNGYINFGCIEVPCKVTAAVSNAKRRKTIVVIGAGMAGLGCARQLEGLFSQFGDRLPRGEGPPNIIVLEARSRLGGRIYSHPLKDQSNTGLPEGKRATADLGAQVVTGFENGNPLGVLIRGQLALHYHSLQDNSVLYDINGVQVDKSRDTLVEKLYNDILDRVAIFKHKPTFPKSVDAAKELIDAGKDPANDNGEMIASIEANEVEVPPLDTREVGTHGGFSAQVDKLTGKPATATGLAAKIPAAEQIRKLGWEIKKGLTGNETVKLEPHGSDSRYPTLGKTMDSVLRQYQNIVDITPQDLRLINWHYANLEYANAANVDSLSLGHWDQDDGNDFSGAHAMLMGGYTQVPRGLFMAPKKLDVKTKHAVRKITYPGDGGKGKTKIECENGKVIEADKVVITLPLGVLKAQAVMFDPPLPEWKTGAIERLGYGLLNKVVLVYNEPFWDVDNDMVGLLREPTGDPFMQESYEANRGRFYMFWNCIKTSGKPMLIALMAGDAANQTEIESDDEIINQATAALSKMYAGKTVPRPTETIITRWRKDPYSRGSYSYVGPEATAEDYDLMAKPVGNSLYFAGEASCRSHPATVHGAYISGLQAASDIVTSILGPIKVPSPLIPPKPKFEGYRTMAGQKRKAEDSAIEKARELREARLEKYEEALKVAVQETLGERPAKPGRSGANPFLLYQKDHWFICKAKCDEARRKATGNPDAKATRNEVRAALGLMWREAPEDEKRPYLNETENNKKSNAASVTEFKKKMAEWDTAANKFKKEWKEKNPSIPTDEEVQLTRQAELELAEIKRTRKLNGFIDDSDEENY